jgi:hypothetical protein
MLAPLLLIPIAERVGRSGNGFFLTMTINQPRSWEPFLYECGGFPEAGFPRACRHNNRIAARNLITPQTGQRAHSNIRVRRAPTGAKVETNAPAVKRWPR